MWLAAAAESGQAAMIPSYLLAGEKRMRAMSEIQLAVILRNLCSGTGSHCSVDVVVDLVAAAAVDVGADKLTDCLMGTLKWSRG